MKKQQLVFIISTSIALFVVNNILLGSVIPRLPGGSATGITTMFAVTLVSLAIKRIWCIPLMYFIYGSIGLVSHLMVSDWRYLLAILTIVLISAIYNGILHRYHYDLAANIVLFPMFVIILQYAIHIDLDSFFLSLLPGYAGIILARICYTILNKHGLISSRE